MSDLDHLDPRTNEAFESLTRDLALSHGPGAAAAMSTARTRRRTRVVAVALAALVVVGGGLSVPQLLSAGVDGVAADGGAAPLDASALEQATEGWLSGWKAWELNAPNAGGSFSVPGCLADDDLAAKEPQVNGGLSRYLGSQFALATAMFAEYPDAATAGTAQSRAYATCSSATTIDVDGTSVRHFAVAPTEAGTSLTDVWTVQIGAERLTLEIAGRAGVATGPVVDRVAEAVVAGLRSGEVQEHYAGDPNAADPDQKPQLPEFPEAGLMNALQGWRAASRSVATTSTPKAPCLSRQEDIGAAAGMGGATPRGVAWRLSGFADETEASAYIASAIDELRACTDPVMTFETLSDGVTLATWDTEGAEGRGAVWLLSVGDRSGVVAVDAADRPMPTGTAEGVAGILTAYLRLPWD